MQYSNYFSPGAILRHRAIGSSRKLTEPLVAGGTGDPDGGCGGSSSGGGSSSSGGGGDGGSPDPLLGLALLRGGDRDGRQH